MTKKGISEWSKDLKSNPKVAKKFVSVKTVSDILKVAKENGYEITEQELMDPDLNTVAGGDGEAAGKAGGLLSGLASSSGLASGAGAITVTVNPNIVVNTAVSTATATAQGATAQSNPTMTISTDITK